MGKHDATKYEIMHLINKHIMKVLQNKFFKIHNVIIAGFLALLGFGPSCEKIIPRVEYGTPSAKFLVNGKIESGVSNKPIQNIRIIMQVRDTAMWDTAFSDNEGKYQVIDKFGFPTDKKYNIQFHDIDGSSNGNYENLDTIVEFKDPKFTNGDRHWYKGETTEEFDIKLNPKK